MNKFDIVIDTNRNNLSAAIYVDGKFHTQFINSFDIMKLPKILKILKDSFGEHNLKDIYMSIRYVEGRDFPNYYSDIEFVDCDI